MSVAAVRHAGIVVSDMERSLPFYRDLLGMKVSVDMTERGEFIEAVTQVPGAVVRIVKLQARDGVPIELLQYVTRPQSIPTPKQSWDVGVNHVALRVDDLDAVYERLRQHGVTFHCPPRPSPDNFAKVTYCRDPEGVIVELMQFLESKSN